MRIRAGRSIERTLYVQHGDKPSKGDQLIGMVDTPRLAAVIVGAVNDQHERQLAELLTIEAPTNLHDGSTMDQLLIRTVAELNEQDRRWGPQNHRDDTGQPGDIAMAEMAKQREEAAAASSLGTSWRLILDEEVREVFAETDADRLITELIQSAAVCLQWAASITRRTEESS